MDMSETDKSGYRIWEIDDKTKVPKEIKSGNMESLGDGTMILLGLDLDNKTYAIRIGKKGLE